MVREDETRRHIEFHAQLRRQAAARRARNIALTGNATTAKTIRDAWKSIILARLEAGYDERDEDE